MKLSVIIPAYNHLPDVMQALNSLRAFMATGVEFIVNDDASPDYFGPAVIPPEIALCQRNAVNLGFGQNCNAGANAASGDVLMFINQDAYGVPDWSNGWDSAILSAFADGHVGVVGARLLFPNGSVQSVGGVFDNRGQPVHRCLGWSNPHHEETATPSEVDWTTGAALAIRRDLFEQIGGFDPAYRMYFEDVDACLKVRELGYKVMYEPRCTLIHPVGSTGGSPHFAASARHFKRMWIDSGKVQPSYTPATVRYW